MKWQNRRYFIQPIPCPVTDFYSNPFYPTISTVNRSFRVPDDDNDSSSDISRADSLAIVGSHPRTFSVPSSDDEEEDEECIALEDHTPGKEVGKESTQGSTNRVTIPGSNAGIRSEVSAGVKASNKHIDVGIHDSMGASQKNPIDLDKGHEPAIDIDSDDDGPEVLPIDHSFTVAGKKFVEPQEDTPGMASQDLWSPACQNADADSNASQYGDEEDFFRDLDQIQVRDTQGQTFGTRPKGPHVSFDLPSPDSMTDARDSFDKEDRQRPSHDINCFGSIDISRAESTEGFHSTQRPSSPSDAALAKKSVAPVDSDSNLNNCEGLQQEGQRKASEAKMSEKHRDYFINGELDQSKFTREQHAGAQMQRQDKSESVNGQTHVRHGDIAMIEPSQCKPLTDVPDLAAHSRADIYPFNARRNAVIYDYPNDLGARNESLKSYSTGPFSTLSDYQSFKPGFSDFYAGPKYDDLYTHPDLYHTGYYANAWNDAHLGHSTHKATSGTGDNWKRPHNIATTLEPYLVGPPPPPPPKLPLSDQFRSPYENPPRVTISDLVNPGAPVSRGQKRKADDMNEEEVIRAPTEAVSPLFDDRSQGSVVLPDAQPRDQPIMPETGFSQESSSIQDTYEPAIQHASTTLGRDDGPARKKAKTSPSKIAGMGKFVSGIAVGVVGVLATFIATIPASVREEALREISNVA